MSDIKGRDPDGWNQQLPGGNDEPVRTKSDYVASTTIDGMQAVESEDHGHYGTRTGRNERRNV